MHFFRVAPFILFITLHLFAFEDFSYQLSTNRSKLIVNEPLVLTLTIDQKKANENMSFLFKLPPKNAYRYELLESKEKKDEKDRSHITSKYAIYPLIAGKIEIEPILIVKYASKEEVKKFVTGSADELTYLKTKDKLFKLKPFTIDVQHVKKETKLIGDYELSYTIDKTRVKSGEQINISYTLKGTGSKIEVDDLIGKIDGCEIFNDKQVYDNKLFHKVTYDYALIPQKSFTIPKVTLLAYSPTKRAYYTLSTPAVEVTVTNQTQNNALVLKDQEKSRFDLTKLLTLGLIFIAGYFSAKIAGFKKLTPKEQFIRKMKKCRDAKELLRILISQEGDFTEQIKKLEDMLYKGKNYKLSRIKRETIGAFQESQNAPYYPPKSHQVDL